MSIIFVNKVSIKLLSTLVLKHTYYQNMKVFLQKSRFGTTPRILTPPKFGSQSAAPPSVETPDTGCPLSHPSKTPQTHFIPLEEVLESVTLYTGCLEHNLQALALERAPLTQNYIFIMKRCFKDPKL